MNIQEIETAASRFKKCPKCNSTYGFWIGLESEHAYVQCKNCGGKLKLFETFTISERTEASKRKLLGK